MTKELSWRVQAGRHRAGITIGDVDNGREARC
jgi:hypothetical protein